MTVRGIGGGPLAPVATTVEELISLQAIENGDAEAHAAQQARETQQRLLSQAQRAQIAEMRTAADKQMWAGILGALGTMADAAGSFGAGLAGGASTGDGQLSTSFGKLGTAGLSIGKALLESEAREAQARQTEQEHAQTSAKTGLDQASSDLQDAHRAVDRDLDALKAVLTERRRAEEAATRA